MCGIVGMAGKLTHQHRQIFRDLLDVCQVRGRDSTGAIRVKPDDTYQWAKMVGPPTFLLETKQYERQIEGDAKVLIGHCRAKTTGEIKTKNAHPFDFEGKVCGVHNGTLQKTWTMDRYRDFDVDSELLYWNISEFGLEDTIKNKVDSDGAWCLVWWDAEGKRLNFLRNDKRPLFFAHSEDRQVMLWASEPWMFNTFARRGLKLWEDENGHSFYPLPEDTLYSFSIDSSKTIPTEIFTMHQPVEIKAEVRSNVGNFHGSRGYYGADHGGKVASPFQKLREVLPDGTILLRNKAGDITATIRPKAKPLDDILDDLTGKLGNLPLLPSPEHTPSVEESTTTPSSLKKSTTSSQSGLVSSMVKKNTSPSSRPRLYTVGSTSKTSRQDNKGELFEDYESLQPNSRPQLPLKKVSLRTVAEMSYITDNKSGREIEESEFEELTGGYCSFCRGPIGGLEHVHEIYTSSTNEVEETFFICTSCVIPAVA